MRFTKTILAVALFVLKCLCPQAQTYERYNTFSYSVNEGLLQSTIGDIAVDQNNFCWISFPNGIQKFDGKDFVTIPAQKGLPDNMFVTFLNTKNGSLLLSHSHGISKYEINNNRFIQIYQTKSDIKKPITFIGEDDNLIYFFSAPGEITAINSHTYKIEKTANTGLQRFSTGNNLPLAISSHIVDHRIAFNINSRLYLWDLKNEKMLAQSDSIPGISRYMLYLKSGHEAYFFTNKINTALQLYNFSTHSISACPVTGKDDQPITRCIIYQWQNSTLISFSNKIYKIDTSSLTLKSELVNFQNEPIAGHLGIARIKEDRFGNLYVQTGTGGIKKIIRNNYPVKYFGTKEKEGNNILSILPDKKQNRILLGTSGNGLLVFDTMQRLIKHVKNLPGSNYSFSPNSILKDHNGNYLLFNTGDKKVWKLSNNFNQVTPIPITSSLPFEKKGIQYFGNILFQNHPEALVQSQGRLYKVNYVSNFIQEHEFTTSYTMGGIWYNNGIISHANEELIFMHPVTFDILKKIPFKNTGYVRCFAKPAVSATDNTSILIYVGSNKGLHKIDTAGNILMHLTTENGLPDNCIYAMAFDEEGYLWASTNKGIFKLNRDHGFLQLKKEDGLQENEFNTNVVAKTEDGEMYFGGVNGVSSFYPAAIGNFKDSLQLYVTQIKVNNTDAFTDTSTWNINNIELPHDQNVLSFNFLAMGKNNPGQYTYQYKMEGIDQQWIPNNDLQAIRYFLPPGKYVLHLYASKYFNKDAVALKKIYITIHPPFWKTWWFLLSAGLLSAILLVSGINSYNKRKFLKKLRELEAEQKIQMERERISRDLHDSLGAYANAVLYNTELLQQEKNAGEREVRIKNLHFASKDIITSLRETIWALKKDNYTAQDCLLRIRNFIQPFNRYYPHIHFQIKGDAPANKTLHYTTALHIVRIVQEAVSNAIKHAEAKNIIVSSSSENDHWQIKITDDGKGFDYENLKKLQQGNGLDNMQQRAADAGIGYTVHSTPETGTTITITA